MSLDPKIIRESDNSVLEFDSFMKKLWPDDEESERFYHVISVLANAAMENYKSLRSAFEHNDQKMIAWSCRNLLEISIFTKYALLSKANADELAGERLVDGLEIAESLKKLDLQLNQLEGQSHFDRLISTFRQQMLKEDITAKKCVRTEIRAVAVGMVEEYRSINKLASKFVHPTAWSVFTADVGSERFEEASELFFVFGAQYFATVYATIAPHVREFGLKHKGEL